MRWTAAKHRVESLLAPSMEGRIKLCCARYRREHDRPARVWLALDGEEIVSFAEWIADERRNALFSQLASADADNREATDVATAADALAARRGDLTYREAITVVHQYPELAISTALASENALVAALAAVDRRVGKRRLATWHASFGVPFVDRLVEARRRAEGLLPRPLPSNEGRS